MRRRLVGALAGAATVAGAAFGGAALRVIAERRAIGDGPLAGDPEWQELQRPVQGVAHRVAAGDGTVLHAEVTGPPDAPTVLLIHGYALSMHAFHHQRRDLSERYRVVAYDQRGHGRSAVSRHGDYSAGALGRDVAAVLHALGPADGRVVAVGHSMGGMSLLSYVDQHPADFGARVAGIALIDTVGGDVLRTSAATTSWAVLSTVVGGAWGGGLRLLGRRPDTEGPIPVDPAWLLTRAIGLSPSASAAQVAFTEQLLAGTPNVVVAALGPVLTRFDLRRVAPTVRVPALVLVGSHDRVTPPAASRALAAALPDAELVELPDAGHMAPLEASAEVTAQLEGFAARVLDGDGGPP